MKSHWKRMIQQTLSVIHDAEIDISPLTSCFTPALPWPRSITPLNSLPPQPTDLSDYQVRFYIHVPFCSRRCSFCPYFVCVRRDVADSFVDSIMKNIEVFTRNYKIPKQVSINIGGGSPNLLSNRQLSRVVDAFSDYRIDNFGIEIHPQVLNIHAYMDFLVELGATHLSIGLQSTDDSVLQFSGRGHDMESVSRLASVAMDKGLRLNIDCMYGGMYNETIHNSSLTFDHVFKKIQPDSVNAYQVSFRGKVNEISRYLRSIENYPDVHEIFEISALIQQSAVDNGYYDIGFGYFGKNKNSTKVSRPRMKSALIAIGPGTYTRIIDEENQFGAAYFSPYSLQEYEQLVSEYRIPNERAIEFDSEYVLRWNAIMNLRTRTLLRDDNDIEMTELLSSLSALDLLRKVEGGYRISDSGKLIEDLICALFFPYSMWSKYSQALRMNGEDSEEYKYDWFYHPDVVLHFLNYLKD